MFDSNSFNKP